MREMNEHALVFGVVIEGRAADRMAIQVDI